VNQVENSTDKIYTVEEIKDIVTPIAESHGVSKVYLFGSYARRKATAKSDVDIWIESGKIKTLFGLGGFYADLEKKLQKPLSLLTDDGMDEKFYNRIKNEEVVIYG
jgi:hypothetical protein